MVGRFKAKQPTETPLPAASLQRSSFPKRFNDNNDDDNDDDEDNDNYIKPFAM